MKFCRIDMSVSLPDVPKMVGIDLLGAAPRPQVGENFNSQYTLLHLFIHLSLCKPDGLTDLQARWLKRRGLLEG
jgi:hypothetical protein